jgi:hypothetical protein
MDSYALLGVGRGVCMPCFLMAGLEMVQFVQDLIYLLTFCQSFDQQKCCFRIVTVSSTPKFHATEL